jgi:D-alanyl-D-alanine carboxypeptidase
VGLRARWYRQLESRLLRRPGRVAALGALLLVTASAGLALPAGALDTSQPGAALVASPDGNGYAVVSAAGVQYDYGSRRFTGNLPSGAGLSSPVVGAADVPAGRGSWITTRDGKVFAVGGARSYGSLTGAASDSDVTSIVPTPSGRGYWLATADGTVAAFGDAGSLGSLDGVPQGGKVVGMAATPTGRGYWLVTAEGAVFPFGDAPALGAPVTTAHERGVRSPRHLVSILSSASGKGYLAVAEDGTTYSYGDFADPGSLAGMHLASPVVAAAPFSHGQGVWLLTRNGGVVALRAPFYGSVVDAKNPNPTTVQAPYYTAGAPTVDGASGGLVALPCSGANGRIIVSALLARQVHDLLEAAGNDGIGLCATSSFRNSQQQVALRAAYCTAIYDPKAACSRPVALPGRSRHEQGLAIDFSATPAGYDWLAAHASAFGLQHLRAFGPQTERWHYSSDGG